MHIIVSGLMKVLVLDLGKIVKGSFIKKENYLQTGLSDLRILVSNGDYKR